MLQFDVVWSFDLEKKNNIENKKKKWTCDAEVEGISQIANVSAHVISVFVSVQCNFSTEIYLNYIH